MLIHRLFFPRGSFAVVLSEHIWGGIKGAGMRIAVDGPRPARPGGGERVGRRAGGRAGGKAKISTNIEDVVERIFEEN